MKRVEDPRLVTGEGRYLDDIRLPDTLYGVFVECVRPRQNQGNRLVCGTP